MASASVSDTGENVVLELRDTYEYLSPREARALAEELVRQAEEAERRQAIEREAEEAAVKAANEARAAVYAKHGARK